MLYNIVKCVFIFLFLLMEYAFDTFSNNTHNHNIVVGYAQSLKYLPNENVKPYCEERYLVYLISNVFKNYFYTVFITNGFLYFKMFLLLF